MLRLGRLKEMLVGMRARLRTHAGFRTLGHVHFETSKWNVH